MKKAVTGLLGSQCLLELHRRPLAAQTVKNLPAMKETWVRSPGQEDPLEKGMATHSSILSWRITRTEEPGGATVHEVAESLDSD